MTRNNSSRRQQAVASIKSAIATAAVLGTIGGWIAFGGQQSDTAVASISTAAPTAGQVIDTAVNESASTVQSQSSTTIEAPTAVPTTSVVVDTTTDQAASTASSQAIIIQPVTRTRSSK